MRDMENRLYTSTEVKKMLGVTSYKLKHLEDNGKLVPVKRTYGMRYYTLEQVMEMQLLVNQKISVAYVAVDCRSKMPNVEDAVELASRYQAMRIRLVDKGIDCKTVVKDQFTSDLKNTYMEKIIQRAVNKELETLYISSDSFPMDKLEEFRFWFGQMGAEIKEV